jgi:predicted AAA-ATPase
MLADEYDPFSNDYLEPYGTSWDGTAVEQTFRSFWSMVKVLHTGGIEKVFITGISPLSLTDIGSGFNVGRNLSSDEDVAAVCGLRRVDMEAALRKLCDSDDDYERHKHCSVMFRLRAMCGRTVRKYSDSTQTRPYVERSRWSPNAQQDNIRLDGEAQQGNIRLAGEKPKLYVEEFEVPGRKDSFTLQI